MTVADLINWLARIPLDTRVAYQDMNFGGAKQAFTFEDIQHGPDGVLIASLHWEEVE